MTAASTARATAIPMRMLLLEGFPVFEDFPAMSDSSLIRLLTLRLRCLVELAEFFTHRCGLFHHVAQLAEEFKVRGVVRVSLDEFAIFFEECNVAVDGLLEIRVDAIVRARRFFRRIRLGRCGDVGRCGMGIPAYVIAPRTLRRSPLFQAAIRQCLLRNGA